MQLGTVGRTLLGGSIVYIVMVACSASDRSSSWTDTGVGGRGGSIDGDESPLADASDGPGGSGQAGGDGHGGDPDDGTGGSWLDAALDALTDPVPDAAADDGTKDGSRLKARYYVADDGARQFAGWFDTQRGEDCTFQVAADGKMRCMPIPRVQGYVLYYADASCSQKIVADATGCATGYAGIWDTSGCGQSRLHLHSLGSTVNSATIYYSYNGSCTPIAKGDTVYRHVGAEIPASSFVGANVQ